MHRALKISLSLLGLLLLLCGSGLLVFAIVSAGSTLQAGEVQPHLILLAPATVLLLAGAALYTAGSRTVAAISAGFAGILLLLGCAGVVLLGFVLDQSSSTAFNHRRAAAAAWSSGAGMFVLGILLLALAIWWANTEQGKRRLQRVAQVLAFGYGAFLFLQGVGILLPLPLLVRSISQQPMQKPISIAATATALAGFGVLALFPGAVFVYHGVSSYFHIPSGRLQLPRAAVLASVFFASILAGALILLSGTGEGVAIPVLHVVAALSAPLALIALATRGGRRPGAPAGAVVTWRQVLLMMSWGMAIAASIAILLESLSLIYTVFAFLVVRHDLNNMRDLQQFNNALSNSNSELPKSVQFLFLIVTVAILGPIIEEFSKGFGVRLLRSNRPGRYQAFIFGLASGAGFAVVEAIEYGFGALSQDPQRWWDTMLLRGGSGALHALASGIVGLAWYQLFIGRRTRGLSLFLIAVGLHSSWNAFNVLTVARIIPYFKDLSDRTLEIGLEVVLGLGAIGLISIIASLSADLLREEQGTEPLSTGLATLILPVRPFTRRSDPSAETQRLPAIRVPQATPEGAASNGEATGSAAVEEATAQEPLPAAGAGNLQGAAAANDGVERLQAGPPLE